MSLLNYLFVAAIASTALVSAVNNSGPAQYSSKDLAIKESNIDSIAAGNQLVHLKAGLDYSLVKPNTSSERHLYVEVNASEFTQNSGSRAPLNLSIVLDRSGSMSGKKLDYAKSSAAMIIRQLSPADRVSLVIYDDDVEVIIPAQKVDNKQTLLTKIESIQSDGSTNLSGGMLEGYAQVKSNYETGAVNRVLLLSDGMANRGITDVNQLQTICQKKFREEGISISTFGVGTDYNEDLMESIAEYGGGNYYFIEKPDMITPIFEKELDGLLSVIAQNATINIQVPKEFTVSDVMGYPFTAENGSVTVKLGDLYSSEKKAVLLKLKTAGITTNVNFNTCLSYFDAVSLQQESNLCLSDELALSSDTSEINRSNDLAVAQQVVVFESNQILQNAMKLVDQNKYDEARAEVQKNKAYLESSKAKGIQSEEIEKQSALNDKYDAEIKEVEHMSTQEKKMLQKSSKQYNYDIKKKKMK